MESLSADEHDVEWAPSEDVVVAATATESSTSSRKRDAGFDGEAALLDAIRQHRGSGQHPRPLARQRSRVRSGGRAWERAASGITNAATDGSDDKPPLRILASPRIAVRGAARTTRQESSNGGGGGRSTREIPRMPSFGGVGARRGRVRGGIAGGSGGRKASKLSNAVDLGIAASTDEVKKPSTSAQVSPQATTWQGFVEMASASVFDSVSVIGCDPRTAQAPLQRAATPVPVSLPVVPSPGPTASGVVPLERRAPAGGETADPSLHRHYPARNLPPTTGRR